MPGGATDSPSSASDVIKRLSQLSNHLQDLISAEVGVVEQPNADAIESVTFIALDDTQFAARTVAAVGSELLPVPLLVADNFDPRPYVGPNSLVVVMAADANDEEAVDAASAAAAQGASLVVMSSEGRLQEFARSRDAVAINVKDVGGIEPTLLPEFLVPALLLLESLELLPMASEWLQTAVSQASVRASIIEKNLKKPELRRLSSLPLKVIYGSGLVGATAADYWKAVINRYEKTLAYSQELPGLLQDGISGWGQHGDLTRQICAVVCLRHDFEHPTAAAQFDRLTEVIGEVVESVVTVRAVGDSPLAQLVDLQFFGSCLSAVSAANTGINPWGRTTLDELL